MSYRPVDKKEPFNVPMILLKPTYTTVNGVRKKTFPDAENGIFFFGTFKTFGGTERDVNGIYSVEDTANVETWYMPEFTSGCRIALANNPNAIYNILGEPENVDMRNQYIVFKVTRVKGGA